MILGNQRLFSLAKNDQVTIEDLAKYLIQLDKDKDTEFFSYKAYYSSKTKCQDQDKICQLDCDYGKINLERLPENL